MTEQDLAILESDESSKYEKDIIEAKKLKTVEISFDNGKTFEGIGKNEKWRYRKEKKDVTMIINEQYEQHINRNYSQQCAF